jgi:hypothetical protein
MSRKSSFFSVSTSQGVFLCDSGDRGIGAPLYARLDDEEYFVTLAESVKRCEAEGWISPDRSSKSFIDVGANIGTCSVAAVTMHGFGSAVSIEPNGKNLML